MWQEIVKKYFNGSFAIYFLLWDGVGPICQRGQSWEKVTKKVFKQICGANLWAICQGGQNWEKLEKIVVGPICEQFAKGVAGK